MQQGELLKMKNPKFLTSLTLAAAVLLSQNMLWGAEFQEESVSITVINAPERQIKSMPSFSQIVISSSDKDQGYVEANGGELKISSNDTYRIQGKISGNTLDAKLQIADSKLTDLTTDYADMFTDGSASLQAAHDIKLRFDVDWLSQTLAAENVTLSLKVLSLS